MKHSAKNHEIVGRIIMLIRLLNTKKGVTMPVLQQKTGLSKRSIYRYFEDFRKNDVNLVGFESTEGYAYSIEREHLLKINPIDLLPEMHAPKVPKAAPIPSPRKKIVWSVYKLSTDETYTFESLEMIPVYFKDLTIKWNHVRNYTKPIFVDDYRISKSIYFTRQKNSR